MADIDTDDEAPGYEARKSISESLPHLTPRARSALAAACAERVLPLATHYKKDDTSCRAAVELTWKYALGAHVSEDEVTAAQDACDELMDFYYDEDVGRWAIYAIHAARSAVQTVDAPESDPAQHALESAHGAVFACFKDAAAELEEIQWQLAALGVALASPQPTREAFAKLPRTAKWLDEYLANGPPNP